MTAHIQFVLNVLEKLGRDPLFPEATCDDLRGYNRGWQAGLKAARELLESETGMTAEVRHPEEDDYVFFEHGRAEHEAITEAREGMAA